MKSVDMPFAASIPHFYGRSEEFTKKFEGLHPNQKDHESFTIVEPTMGVPMEQAARSQVNLVIPKFSYLFERDYQRFSDMILPMFWIEYVSKTFQPPKHLSFDENIVDFFFSTKEI